MQIVLFLIFVLLILLVVVSKKNAFSKTTKIYMTVVIAVLTIAIYFYESSQEKNEQHNRAMLNAFRQGKTLTCKEYRVDQEKFIYVSGTQSFVAKASEKSLEGVVVAVSTCKVN